MLLLFSTKVSQAAFTKVIMPVIGCKVTIKRGKNQIIGYLFCFLIYWKNTSKGVRVLRPYTLKHQNLLYTKVN